MSTPKINNTLQMQKDLAKIGVILKVETEADLIILVQTYTKLIEGFDPERGRDCSGYLYGCKVCD